MSQRFDVIPLFDSYQPFYALGRGELFPGDIPAVKAFVESLEDVVSESINDYRHVKDFLWSKCRRSEATYNAFRSESERFLLWAWCVHGKSIAALKKRDIEAYIDFVVSPPKSWIGTQVCRRFTVKNGLKEPNKEWRPFVAKISKAERKESLKRASRKESALFPPLVPAWWGEKGLEVNDLGAFSPLVPACVQNPLSRIL